MTANQFKGPRAKLRAVRRHGKAFREELNRYLVLNKDAWTFGVKPPSTDLVMTATLSPVPEDVSVIVGEIANQLRSSLDLLACDLARWSGATNVSDVYFPIAKTEEGYLDKRSRNKIKKLKPELQAMIDATKPYGDSILVALNALASMDKHQALLDAIPSIKNTEYRLFGTGNFKSADFWFRIPSRNEHRQVELLRLPAGTPVQEANVKLHCHIIFTVEPIVGKPVSEVLTDMARAVEAIIRWFETYCFPV